MLTHEEKSVDIRVTQDVLEQVCLTGWKQDRQREVVNIRQDRE